MRLIALFFDIPGSQVPFNFLHRQTFMRNIMGQQGFLLLAMQSLASSYDILINAPDTEERYYREARKMINQVYDRHSVSAVQALLILSTCSASMNEMNW